MSAKKLQHSGSLGQLPGDECAGRQSREAGPLAKKADVPTPPGSEGVVDTRTGCFGGWPRGRIGYPGDDQSRRGRGGREFCAWLTMTFSAGQRYHTARGEAEKAFGNSGVYGREVH